MHEQDTEAAALAANLESTCGPAARYADHQVGETITYLVSQHEVRSGTILFVAAPTQIVSQHIPLTYVCHADVGDSFPDLVYQSDVCETAPWSPPAD